MDLQLTGQTAVVVGGASGIGRAIAAAFLQEGARVVLADVAGNVAEVAAEIQSSLGGEAIACPTNVTDPKSVARLTTETIAHFGGVDHVVYAAGMGSGQYGFPFWDVEPAVWIKVLEVNLVGAVQVAHVFAGELTRRKQGTMLFLSSVAGQIGSQTDPPYSAAKAGLINFAICAAKDLASYGVRVNCLCPGMIRTPLNRSVWQAWADKQPPELRTSYEEWAEEKIRKVVPLGRWQEPEDVAAMAVFLASERAHNVTGQVINVDGGFVMHW